MAISSPVNFADTRLAWPAKCPGILARRAVIIKHVFERTEKKETLETGVACIDILAIQMKRETFEDAKKKRKQTL